MTLAVTSEAELLALMSMQGRDPERARAAWGELFERHRRYLYAVVSRSYGSFLGEDGTVDLVCDAFRRAFEWAGRQTDSDEVRVRFSANDSDSTRRRVLGWLGAIAEQLFRDRYREQSTAKDEFAQFLDHWKADHEHPAEAGDSTLLAHLQAALALLSGPEAEALRASLPWYDAESRTFAVPRGEAARLSAALGTTPENLRQRRHRAIKRIEAYFEQAGYAARPMKESR